MLRMRSPGLRGLLLAAVLLLPAGGCSSSDEVEGTGDTGAGGPQGAALRYRVSLPQPAGQHFEVEIRVAAGSEESLGFVMPSWTWGRWRLVRHGYRVRDAHAVDEAGDPLPVERMAPDRWVVRRTSGHTVRMRYRCRGPRAEAGLSWAGDSGAFVAGASLFMMVEGHREDPVVLELSLPAGWRALGSAVGDPGQRRGTRHAGYDHLVRSPLLLGPLEEFRCTSPGGTPITLALLSARPAAGAVQEMLEPLGRIVGEVEGLSGDRAAGHVLLHTAPGLAPDVAAFPGAVHVTAPGGLDRAVARAEVLGLTAEGLVRSWNGRRVMPASLRRPDRTVELDTWFVWLTRGGSRHLARLVRLRAGLLDEDGWLAEVRDLAETATRRGRVRAGTLHEAGRLVWDPGTEGLQAAPLAGAGPRGELTALALDARLRAATRDDRGLPDLVRALAEEAPRGYSPADVHRILVRLGSEDLGFWLDTHVRGKELPDLRRTLKPMGLLWNERYGEARASLGGILDPDGKRVVFLEPDSPLARGGIQVGDRLVSLGGYDLGKVPLERALQELGPGSVVGITVRRHNGEVLSRSVRLGRAVPVVRTLTRDPEASREARELRNAWLLGSTP